MKNLLLFPYTFRPIGWVILILSFAIGLLGTVLEWEFDCLNWQVFAIHAGGILEKDVFLGWVKDNVTNEFLGLFLLFGLMLVGFSRVQHEDEYTLQMRYNALMWAAWTNCLLMVFTMVFFYGTSYWFCMLFNMYSVMTIYVLRFGYLLHKSKNQSL